MLTFLAIAVLAIFGLSFWILNCIVKVKPKFQVVIGKNFGSLPSRLLSTGLHWTWFPCERIIATIKMDRFQLNIANFKAVCTMDRNQFLPEEPEDDSGLAEITIPNISLNGELNFLDENKYFDLTKFENYNRYVEDSTDGNPDLSEMTEEILDIAKSLFVEIISYGDIVQTLKSQFTYSDGDKITLDEIRQIINTDLEVRKIPARITSLKIDNPPVISDSNLATAWNKISQGAMLDQAQKLELERKLASAIKEFEISKKNAEAQKVFLETLADVFQVNKLSPKEQALFWLNREALDSLRNSKATYFIGGDILGQISQMLKHFTG